MNLMFTKIFRFMWVLFFVLFILLDKNITFNKIFLIFFIIFLAIITIFRILDSRDEWRKIVEEELPDAMTSVNLRTFELEDGTNFSVKDEIFVSIREDRRAGALKWLEDNGHGDLIKHDVKVSFGRGDHESAEDLKKILGKSFKSIPYDERMNVHSGTLKVFAKERYSLGETLPEEHFSVYEASVAKVKLGKEK